MCEEYFMKQAVKSNGLTILFAGPEIQSNREIVLLAAKKNGIFLTYPSFNQFLNDREIMLEACKSHPNVIEILPDHFKNDYQFAFEILSTSNGGGSAIRTFPESIRYDKEIILNGFLLNSDLLRPVLNKIDLMDDDEFIFNLYKSGLPKILSFKSFSQLIVVSWKKNGLMDKDENNGVIGKHGLIKRIIELYPEAEIHFQKYQHFVPKHQK